MGPPVKDSKSKHVFRCAYWANTFPPAGLYVRPSYLESLDQNRVVQNFVLVIKAYALPWAVETITSYSIFHC